MHFYQDAQFGGRMITLMAALVLTLQIAMVGQRWLVTNIRIFAASFHRPEEAASPASLGHNTLAVAVSLFLIGFFMVVSRRKALMQVLALLSLENGLFLAAISLTYGMPMIVELGVFFDLLVAVMVLGILVYRIQETFDSMDVSKLSRLRG